MNKPLARLINKAISINYEILTGKMLPMAEIEDKKKDPSKIKGQAKTTLLPK